MSTTASIDAPTIAVPTAEEQKLMLSSCNRAAHSYNTSVRGVLSSVADGSYYTLPRHNDHATIEEMSDVINSAISGRIILQEIILLDRGNDRYAIVVGSGIIHAFSTFRDGLWSIATEDGNSSFERCSWSDLIDDAQSQLNNTLLRVTELNSKTSDEEIQRIRNFHRR